MKLVSSALGALFACAAAQAAPAKNLIFFLGDGMGPAIITAARIEAYKEEGSLHFEKMERVARIRTYSADAQTTDSAPSMGAYMTGIKINNDVISMADAKPFWPTKDANGNGTVNGCLPGNGRAARTILELAKAAGKSVGAISTTELTHATPASTFAHSCHRGAGYEIARQIVPGGEGYNRALGDGVDVLMGGGRHHFTPYSASNSKGRADGRDLLAEFAARGYTVAADRESMLAAQPGRKFVGVYNDNSHLEYHDRRPPGQPTLSDMALKAIDLLAPDPDGFFLMVEGGKIDHGLHNSRPRDAIGELIEFDNALKATLDKMNQLDPGLRNTLIVLTADHDHALAFNGYSKRGNSVLDVVRTYTDGKPTLDADGKTYTTLVFGNGPNRPEVRGNIDEAALAGHEYQHETGVRMSGETHGGGDVKLFAAGAGSAVFKGTMENTRVFHLMKAAAGL